MTPYVMRYNPPLYLALFIYLFIYLFIIWEFFEEDGIIWKMERYFSILLFSILLCHIGLLRLFACSYFVFIITFVTEVFCTNGTVYVVWQFCLVILIFWKKILFLHQHKKLNEPELRRDIKDFYHSMRLKWYFSELSSFSPKSS